MPDPAERPAPIELHTSSFIIDVLTDDDGELVEIDAVRLDTEPADLA